MSKVRPLIEDRVSQDSVNSNIRVLSDEILYLITKFDVSKNHELPKKCYSGDASLFELGCYLYFLVDLWHFRNGKKEFRNDVVNYLMDEFIKIFSIVFEPNYANKILQNRFDLYSKVANKESFVEDSLFYLEELILRTGDNKTPSLVEIDNFGAITLGVMETWPVKVAIQEFLVHFSPLMYNRIKEFYESIEESG